jgi:lipoprotein signal peptidase
LAFVLFLFVHSGRHRRSLHLALGLVLAGALGNLYDRTYMIADVVRCSAGGRRDTFVGKVIEQSDRGVVLGSWPSGAHPRLIRADWGPEIRQQGVVRDFIKMEPRIRLGSRTIEMWPWVFNVADSLLVVGVGLLMLNFWWERRASRNPE